MSATHYAPGRDTLSALRLVLRANGYRPVPVAGPKMQCKSPGKQPVMKDWRRVCETADEAEVRRWVTAEPGCTNTGLLAGALAAIDVDVPVPELAAQVEALAMTILGPTPLRRVGQAPKSLLTYQHVAPLPKMETPELFLSNGKKVQVEILGAGQQFVAYGTHPVTGEDYLWSDSGPDVVPLSDLPSVTATGLRDFLTAAEDLLRRAGGRTQQELDAAAREAAEGPAAQARPDATTTRPKGASGPRGGAAGDGFFKAVNRAALESLAAWVPRVFPKAKQQETGAYRVTSADLGRAYEEDLSIHPDGIQDFGPRRGLSPCDLVMEWGGAPDVQQAAFILCEWLGRDPADFGWRGKAKSRSAGNHQRDDDPQPRTDKPNGAAGPAADPQDLDGFALTEDGVALAFAAKFKDALRYCHHSGSWFQWGGSTWRREETKLAFSWARHTCRAFATQANKPSVAASLSRAATAAAVERFAQADRAFAVTADNWNPDPWLLGTPGGTVDLRTGTMRPARPGDMITRTTAVAPGASADAPVWEAFLKQATAGDMDLIRFLKRWCGYCLTGLTREHALLFIHGPGGNGKTVFLNTVAGILGDYHTTAAMDTFTDSGGGRHLAFLAMLAGARMVTAAETEEGRPWAETRIKEMTGGTPVTANFMRQNPFTFMPQFKITITGNHKPELRNVDDAARRRFNIVPFLHKPAEPDRTLEDKLRKEWPAILTWMIDGCLSWSTGGLLKPKVVTEATDEYFAAQDAMGQWMAERCILDPSLAERPAILLADLNAWLVNNGEQPTNRNRFRGWAERQPKLKYKELKGYAYLAGVGLKVERGSPREPGEEG